MKKRFTNQQGYIALIAVLIVSAVTLAISLSLNSLSIGETTSGLLKQQSAQSFGLAGSCLQEAWLRLKRDPTFAGDSLNNSLGSCTITVVGSGNDRTITVESDVRNIRRRLESQVTTSGNILTVQSWTEVTTP
jgi:hypothetical protein